MNAKPLFKSMVFFSSLLLPGLLEASSILYDFESSQKKWELDSLSQGTELRLSKEEARSGRSSLKVTLNLPGRVSVMTKPEANWSAYAKLSLCVFLPRKAPEGIALVAYLKDIDLGWYQYRNTMTLKPGCWNVILLSLEADAGLWEPHGHSKPWNGYTTQMVKEFGLSFYSNSSYGGAVYLDELSGEMRREERGETNLYNFRVNSDDIGLYEKFELAFELPRVYSNPFNPDEVDITAHFISPTGRVQTIPAFFYQDYIRQEMPEPGFYFVDSAFGPDRRPLKAAYGKEILIPRGPPEWRVRFAPTEPGTYNYYLAINDGRRTVTKKRTFECTSSKKKGFVRVSGKDNYCFEFDNGEPYYPIGHNLSWPSTRGTFDYDLCFDLMADSGCNWARSWMTSWWIGLEWSPSWPYYQGLGRYNLQNAWKVDYLLEEAERKGIYLELVLEQFGPFDAVTKEGQWHISPYNAALGGPLRSGADYFSNRTTRELFKRKLRYMIARWGYSPHLLAWDLFNESGMIRGYDKRSVAKWHKEMASFIHLLDPWNHLVTTFAQPGIWGYPDKDKMWQLEELDFCQFNAYHRPDIVAKLNEIYQQTRSFKKPVVPIEFWRRVENVSKEFLHAALWGAYTLPLAGSAMPWDWKLLLEGNLYTEFQALAKFSKGEDRRGRGLHPGRVQFSGGVSELRGQSLQNDVSAYVWIYDRQSYLSPGEVRVKKGAVVSLFGLKDGSYMVEFWDTHRGIITENRRSVASGGRLSFPLPPLKDDLACKLRRE